jgi:hypothetical protein
VLEIEVKKLCRKLFMQNQVLDAADIHVQSSLNNRAVFNGAIDSILLNGVTKPTDARMVCLHPGVMLTLKL